ncbi:nicotinic acid mononucleotide adenylyltransferase [Thermosipho africanus Ob7]|jgi:nicotinate-nucleotide adenylyltransferase|uniref:Probable nicotinate-nucleotide adenylyltransferase n=1 Tax=Thermosipho africanus (strain TCF52B) TaxID=484019 RepID=B7IGK9_THEAB|nr:MULTISPECIES: nicotinate (nicotinamide) nucleotide adenylyltransferase [Thermosipho]HCF38962.1 nicotinate (nicotinamide) nucleotide adenylyltransferase [Thermosipho africanus]ACJ75223.1 nicotinate (nicotinamide) nucleotide adenylyltransferase [Thermosipho africanus TCF52B]MBZ4650184.1 nadD [Thermosipho sp. (in: thermotogales)]MDK2839411.1 nicotinate-nucleotide adenylyltransferase [Thermosipho sp. (in: thermotogales)]MDK2900768.1 nicotinate-nucleotide adenylyltransferase [Thermosipho sp. (in
MAIQFGLPKELLNTKNSLVIFGGSFNPPHNGHIIIAQLVREMFKYADMHIVTSSTPPHKHVDVDFKTRFYLTKKAFEKVKGVEISDIENKLGGISYAINTIEYYEKYYESIFFLVGEDALFSIEKWYRYEDILKKVKMLVYPRYKDKTLYERANNVLKELSNSIYILDLPLIQISSTIVRERVKNKQSIYGFVPESIIELVEEVYGDR